MKDSSIEKQHAISLDDSQAAAMAVVQKFLDAPGNDNGKLSSLKGLTGRQKAYIANTKEGREVIRALLFDAAVTGGVSGGQLKALALLSSGGVLNSLMNGFDKVKASKTANGEVIEVEASRNGDDLED